MPYSPGLLPPNTPQPPTPVHQPQQQLQQPSPQQHQNQLQPTQSHQVMSIANYCNVHELVKSFICRNDISYQSMSCKYYFLSWTFFSFLPTIFRVLKSAGQSVRL